MRNDLLEGMARPPKALVDDLYNLFMYGTGKSMPGIVPEYHKFLSKNNLAEKHHKKNLASLDELGNNLYYDKKNFEVTFVDCVDPSKKLIFKIKKGMFNMVKTGSSRLAQSYSVNTQSGASTFRSIKDAVYDSYVYATTFMNVLKDAFESFKSISPSRPTSFNIVQVVKEKNAVGAVIKIKPEIIHSLVPADLHADNDNSNLILTYSVVKSSGEFADPRDADSHGYLAFNSPQANDISKSDYGRDSKITDANNRLLKINALPPQMILTKMMASHKMGDLPDSVAERASTLIEIAKGAFSDTIRSTIEHELIHYFQTISKERKIFQAPAAHKKFSSKYADMQKQNQYFSNPLEYKTWINTTFFMYIEMHKSFSNAEFKQFVYLIEASDGFLSAMKDNEKLYKKTLSLLYSALKKYYDEQEG